MSGLLGPVLVLLFLGLVATPGGARAQTFDAGPYLGASAGVLVLQDNEDSAGPFETATEFDPGYDLALQLGYRFSALRGELELEYGEVGIDSVRVGGASVNADGDLSMLRGTAGLYFDFTLLPLFTPYAGGGVGAAHIEGDATVVDGVRVEFEDDTHLTAHGEVGLAFDLLPLVSIVPAYRFIWIDNGEGEIEDTTGHVIKLGARVEF